MVALLTNKTFQVFFIILAGVAAITVLIATNSIPESTGLPILAGILGVGVGAPVTLP
jgi:hypothetical protein